jgi:hypothetical protein
MLFDLYDAARASIRAGLREFKRLRWVRQYASNIKTPFEG